MRRQAQIFFLLLTGLIATALPAQGPITAAPRTAALVEAWHSEGVASGEEWGYAIASAGDVNGDGYDDILVGAPKYGSNREGGAFAFFGGPGGLRVPGTNEIAADLADWRSTGEKGSRYGGAVAGIGDFNCDGLDDVAVGAPEYNNGTTTAGAVFVFFSTGDGLAVLPGWQAVSAQGGASFGYAVTGAGDANHDGCDDLLVGARWYANGQDSEGAVFLFYGASGMPDEEHDWLAEGHQAGATFGASVGGLGDVNDDGIDDFVVGAPFWSSDTHAHAGGLFVFYGSDSGPGLLENWRAEGDRAEANLGWAVGPAGDVNGDGLADLVAGMPGYGDEPYQAYGVLLVFHGRAGGLSATADQRIAGEQIGGGFARAAAAAGDVNADGFDDVLLGAPTFSGDKSKEGAAYLFLGGESGLGDEKAWAGEGNKADASFGFAVAGAGSVNGDIAADLLIGAPIYRDQETNAGKAVVFHGESGSRFFATYLPFVLTP